MARRHSASMVEHVWARPLALLMFGAWLSLGACGQAADTVGDRRTSGSENAAGHAGAGGTSSFSGTSSAGQVSNAGSGVAIGTAGSAGSSVVPVYSRECILSRMGQSGASVGGAAGTDNTPASEAGAGGADFGLGAGDLTVLVVFDKSGSMSSGWDSRNKWQVANEAFMKAIEGVLDNLTLGTIFFPQATACDVAPLSSELQFEFMPGRDFATRWEASMQSRAPDGSTPLGLAFVVADQAIEEACRLDLLDDRFRVVLITDGEPNCETNNDALIAFAAEWARVGVETTVMGLPGSAAAEALLDAIARAGGTHAAQKLGDPSELDQGLFVAVR